MTAHQRVRAAEHAPHPSRGLKRSAITEAKTDGYGETPCQEFGALVLHHHVDPAATSRGLSRLPQGRVHTSHWEGHVRVKEQKADQEEGLCSTDFQTWQGNSA